MFSLCVCPSVSVTLQVVVRRQFSEDDLLLSHHALTNPSFFPVIVGTTELLKNSSIYMLFINYGKACLIPPAPGKTVPGVGCHRDQGLSWRPD